FNRRGRAVGGPFHEDSGIGFDSFEIHRDGKVIHLPIPDNLPARLQPAAAFAEPESGDGGIDESLKHFGDGLADQHLGLGDWLILDFRATRSACFTVAHKLASACRSRSYPSGRWLA